MKKVLVILLFCFIVFGCNNTVNLDFNDKINTKIEISFTSSEFKNYSNVKSDDISYDIEAMINDAHPFIDSYNESFTQNYFKKDNNKYKGEFEYSYTYQNFKNNAIFKRCFDVSSIEENEGILYVYLKGDSICAPFTLKVKSDNRILNNNASKIRNGEYIWDVKEKNNNIFFNISKTEVETESNASKNIFYIILFVIIIGSVLFIDKKVKNRSY